jgi:predicted Rossmann-fold nucleotide-binding protein
VATSSDGIIAVGGGIGTLIEMSVGYMIKKKIVAISASGGVSSVYAGRYLDERNRVLIESAAHAKSAVQAILNERKNT